MKIIPYGRQSIGEEDIDAVCSVLRSDWLTTGPKVDEFEQAVADYVGSQYAVAVSSGTAALHCAMYALGIGPGDEVIVPSMTFAATANCVVYQGGTPVFADVTPDTLLIDPEKVEEKITDRTKAIIAVDYAGQPCDYSRLQAVAKSNELNLVSDSCHALGAEYQGKRVGTLADMTVFSFHPVKHITTGEGGMVVTDNDNLCKRLRLFRNHGISSDIHQRESRNSWHYDISDLGYNYRITDIQCALGASQLRRLPDFLKRRREIAEYYDEAFSFVPEIDPLSTEDNVVHAYHLYVVKIDFETLGIDRSNVFKYLRKNGVGVNVHYIPVHMHPFYRKKFGTAAGMCPSAEKAYEQILSLPIYPALEKNELGRIVDVLLAFIGNQR